MHRTVDSLDRPEPHVFVPSPDSVCGAAVTLSQSGRPAICGLPKANTLHVPAAEVYGPTPADDVSDRIVGDG